MHCQLFSLILILSNCIQIVLTEDTKIYQDNAHYIRLLKVALAKPKDSESNFKYPEIKEISAVAGTALKVEWQRVFDHPEYTKTYAVGNAEDDYSCFSIPTDSGCLVQTLNPVSRYEICVGFCTVDECAPLSSKSCSISTTPPESPMLRGLVPQDQHSFMVYWNNPSNYIGVTKYSVTAKGRSGNAYYCTVRFPQSNCLINHNEIFNTFDVCVKSCWENNDWPCSVPSCLYDQNLPAIPTAPKTTVYPNGMLPTITNGNVHALIVQTKTTSRASRTSAWFTYSLVIFIFLLRVRLECF